MAQHLTKRFVNHRNIRPAAKRVAKLTFHHAERRFDVAALVIVLQKFLALEHEIVKHLAECATYSASSIASERDKGAHSCSARSFSYFTSKHRLKRMS